MCIRDREQNIGHALGVRAVGDGVGGVVQEGEVGHLLILDGIEEGVNGAVALAGYLKNSIGAVSYTHLGAGSFPPSILNISGIHKNNHTVRCGYFYGGATQI